jgi:hypothetical protein
MWIVKLPVSALAIEATKSKTTNLISIVSPRRTSPLVLSELSVFA